MATKFTVDSVNAQLKASNIRVKLSRFPGKNTLFLRATLPPKPGSDRIKPYQQRIALNVYDNEVGLRFAKGEAIKLAGLLDTYQFSWESYKPELFDRPEVKKPKKTCQEWVQDFEAEFFAIGDRTLTTWKDYRKVFKFLPSNEPLTFDLAKEVILNTKANTKTRERTTDKMASLCEFAEIENASNLRKYRGTYSQKGKNKPLVVPSYQEIFDCIPGFHTEEWRNAFCLQAAFGLRNHEIYHVDLSKIDKGLLIVGEKTKTGYRVVPTCHSDWIDQWNLSDILPQDLPQSTAIANEDLGRLVWKAYKRAGVPFSPYSLRHRFALDCAIQNKPLSLVVKAMGHSIAVHSKIYHAFLTEADMLAGWYR